jgi:hypothetical protein
MNWHDTSAPRSMGRHEQPVVASRCIQVDTLATNSDSTDSLE